MNTRRRVTAIPALLAAGTLATLPIGLRNALAQATPEATASQWGSLGLPELNLTVTAESVEGMPESLEAGRYLLNVTGEPTPNDWGVGVMLLQLPQDFTLEEAMAQGAEAQDGPPEFYYESHLPGGGVAPTSGDSAVTSVSIVDLQPGDWIAAGMYFSRPPVPFTVTGEMPADLPEPESTATITMQEMSIEVTAGELTAGENLIKVENIGAQPHFVEIGKLPDGTTEENFEATLEFDMTGTPVPGMVDFNEIQLVANSGDMSPGVTMWMSVTLEPGAYGALCFVPDTESGTPHAFMGMYTFFTIE